MSVSYLKALPLTEALFWFIENVGDVSPDRNEMFFHLRERVREQREESDPAGVRFLVVTGDPGDGFDFTGPFDTRDEAIEYGAKLDPDWWVCEVEAPEV